MALSLNLRLGAFGVSHESLVDREFPMSTAEDFEDAEVTTGKAIVPAEVPKADQTAMAVNALLGQSGPQAVHNLTGSQVEVWRALTLGENKADSLSDLVGKGPIAVKNWYLKKVEIIDPATGEVQEPIRTVLYTDDGRILACTSNGIAKSMAGIISVFGVGPYDPAIKVEVIEVTTARKFKMLTLIPAG